MSEWMDFGIWDADEQVRVASILEEAGYSEFRFNLVERKMSLYPPFEKSKISIHARKPDCGSVCSPRNYCWNEMMLANRINKTPGRDALPECCGSCRFWDSESSLCRRRSRPRSELPVVSSTYWCGEYER